MMFVDFTANDIAVVQAAINGINRQDALTETFSFYDVLCASWD